MRFSGRLHFSLALWVLLLWTDLQSSANSSCEVIHADRAAAWSDFGTLGGCPPTLKESRTTTHGKAELRPRENRQCADDLLKWKAGAEAVYNAAANKETVVEAAARTTRLAKKLAKGAKKLAKAGTVKDQAVKPTKLGDAAQAEKVKVAANEKLAKAIGHIQDHMQAHGNPEGGHENMCNMCTTEKLKKMRIKSKGLRIKCDAMMGGNWNMIACPERVPGTKEVNRHCVHPTTGKAVYGGRFRPTLQAPCKSTAGFNCGRKGTTSQGPLLVSWALSNYMSNLLPVVQNVFCPSPCRERCRGLAEESKLGDSGKKLGESSQDGWGRRRKKKGVKKTTTCKTIPGLGESSQDGWGRRRRKKGGICSCYAQCELLSCRRYCAMLLTKQQKTCNQECTDKHVAKTKRCLKGESGRRKLGESMKTKKQLKQLSDAFDEMLTSKATAKVKSKGKAIFSKVAELLQIKETAGVQSKAGLKFNLITGGIKLIKVIKRCSQPRGFINPEPDVVRTMEFTAKAACIAKDSAMVIFPRRMKKVLSIVEAGLCPFVGALVPPGFRPVVTYAKPARCYRHPCLCTQGTKGGDDLGESDCKPTCKIMQIATDKNGNALSYGNMGYAENGLRTQNTPGYICPKDAARHDKFCQFDKTGRMEYIEGHPDPFCSSFGDLDSAKDDATKMNARRANYLITLERPASAKFWKTTRGGVEMPHRGSHNEGKKLNHPFWYRCAMRTHAEMPMCDTCCCRQGLTGMNVQASLLEPQGGPCRAFFVAADGMIRAAFSAYRTASMITQYGDHGAGCL